MSYFENIKCPKHYVNVASMLKRHHTELVEYLDSIQKFNIARRNFPKAGNLKGEARVLQNFRYEFMSKNVGGIKIHNNISDKLTIICMRRAINNSNAYLKYLKNQIKLQDIMSSASNKNIKIKIEEK